MTPPADRLVDTFGRTHTNLRISVTDRCNLRCVYCMPETATFLPTAELLTFDEIERIVRVAASLGVDHLRLTGGEPLARPRLPDLVARLTAIPGIRDLSLTTNGILLAPVAQALRDSGLSRINISLDTLDPDRFRQWTRRDGLDRVLDGIHAARRANLFPIKLNAVAIRDRSEPDVVPLARFAREHGLELRFIEYMPLDADDAWSREEVLSAAELLDLLSEAFGPLDPSPDQDPRAPATDYDYQDGGGRVGLIASVSRPFCQTCNRLRLTAEGKLRNCLFALDETDLRPLLRRGAPDSDLAEALSRSVLDKAAGHEILLPTFSKPTRPMHAIGG